MPGRSLELAAPVVLAVMLLLGVHSLSVYWLQWLLVVAVVHCLVLAALVRPGLHRWAYWWGLRAATLLLVVELYGGIAQEAQRRAVPLAVILALLLAMQLAGVVGAERAGRAPAGIAADVLAVLTAHVWRLLGPKPPAGRGLAEPGDAVAGARNAMADRVGPSERS